MGATKTNGLEQHRPPHMDIIAELAEESQCQQRQSYCTLPMLREWRELEDLRQYGGAEMLCQCEHHDRLSKLCLILQNCFDLYVVQ